MSAASRTQARRDSQAYRDRRRHICRVAECGAPVATTRTGALKRRCPAHQAELDAERAAKRKPLLVSRSFRLSSHEWAWLEGAAAASGLPVATFVRRWLHELHELGDVYVTPAASTDASPNTGTTSPRSIRARSAEWDVLTATAERQDMTATAVLRGWLWSLGRGK